MKFYDIDVASFSHTHRKNVTDKKKKDQKFSNISKYKTLKTLQTKFSLSPIVCYRN